MYRRHDTPTISGGDMLRRAAPAAVLAALMISACASSDSATSPAVSSTTTTATAPPAAAPTTAPAIAPAPASTAAPATTGPESVAAITTIDPRDVDMRGLRYCEVLLVNIVNGAAIADVYNSYPMNTCPAEQWATLDAQQIATDEGSVIAVLNGPRYWLMNHVEKSPSDDQITKTFGGIEMIRRATVDVGDIKAAAVPYTPHAVNRSTVFAFDTGMEVYELTADDGTVYVMQTYSQQKDPSLQESDLAGLAARLQLPPGWSFSSRVLDEPLQVVTTDGPAYVLQDDLGNSYSRKTSS